MIVERLTVVNEQMLADINHVNQQLHDDLRKGTLSELRMIVEDKNCAIVVAKDGEKIVGIATLYILQKIGTRSAYIEDVVVDSNYRGKGLGEKLVREVIEIARAQNVRKLYLTSRQIHTAAHSLYRKVGFKVKETTVFRLGL